MESDRLGFPSLAQADLFRDPLLAIVRENGVELWIPKLSIITPHNGFSVLTFLFRIIAQTFFSLSISKNQFYQSQPFQVQKESGLLPRKAVRRERVGSCLGVRLCILRTVPAYCGEAQMQSNSMRSAIPWSS